MSGGNIEVVRWLMRIASLLLGLIVMLFVMVQLILYLAMRCGLISNLECAANIIALLAFLLVSFALVSRD